LDVALFHRGHFDHQCILLVEVQFSVVSNVQPYIATKQGLNVVCCPCWYCT